MCLPYVFFQEGATYIKVRSIVHQVWYLYLMYVLYTTIIWRLFATVILVCLKHFCFKWVKVFNVLQQNKEQFNFGGFL